MLIKYVTTANNEIYNNNWDLINAQFPSFKSYDKNTLMEYVATANNKIYDGNWNIINSKFPEYFVHQSDIDSIKFFNSQISFIEKEISEKSIISMKKIKDYTYITLIWVFIVIFGFRYLFYITKWSIQTIKK